MSENKNQLSIATWNVNSIRSRVEKVTAWLAEKSIDVLLMQETKCKNDQFPYEPFENLGYQVTVNGSNQWSGVAIASRVGIENLELTFPLQPGFSKDSTLVPPPVEPRAIFATCGDIRVASLYVPNGRALDDPHYQYKLEWLAALQAHTTQLLESDPQIKLILGGDWNIAPLDEDVWDIEFFRHKTHTSDRERAAFNRFITSGMHDSVRKYTSAEQPYTYWDYTQLRFQRNQGMRIDFLLNSPSLNKNIIGAWIDKTTRYGKGTSDHVPVVLELENN